MAGDKFEASGLVCWAATNERPCSVFSCLCLSLLSFHRKLAAVFCWQRTQPEALQKAREKRVGGRPRLALVAWR